MAGLGRAALAAAFVIQAAAALAADGDNLPTLGGGGGNGSVAAAPPPGWNSLCQAPSRAAPLECHVEQRAVIAQTGQLVASILVRVPGDTRKPALMIRVPLGLSIDAGVTIDIDGAGGRSLPLQTCDGGGCYAGAPLPADLLAAMSRGQKFNIVFQNVSKEPIRLAMSLSGFAKAFDGIK